MTNARAAVWKRVLATILDLITVFSAAGYAIAKLTGNTTQDGFKLEGGPAFVLFGVTVAYFIIGRKIAGGTLWDRVFGIKRSQPD